MERQTRSLLECEAEVDQPRDWWAWNIEDHPPQVDRGMCTAAPSPRYSLGLLRQTAGMLARQSGQEDSEHEPLEH